MMFRCWWWMNFVRMTILFLVSHCTLEFGFVFVVLWIVWKDYISDDVHKYYL